MLWKVSRLTFRLLPWTGANGKAALFPHSFLKNFLEHSPNARKLDAQRGRQAKGTREQARYGASESDEQKVMDKNIQCTDTEYHKSKTDEKFAAALQAGNH